MLIPNPWPNHPMTRFTTSDGVVGMVSTRAQQLEVPDGTVEVLLEPMSRNQQSVVSTPRVWSEKWGSLSLEDHKTKLELEEERDKNRECTNGPPIRLDDPRNNEVSKAVRKVKKVTL